MERINQEIGKIKQDVDEIREKGVNPDLAHEEIKKDVEELKSGEKI